MKKQLWEKCAEFHGHECGGLTIGFKAALYIIELLGLRQDESGCVSDTEDLVCVAENKTCSVDAIRVILGCTERKGNLQFHLTDSQSFTVFNRRTREAVRIMLKDRPAELTREQSLAYYQSKEPSVLFERRDVTLSMPEVGRKNETYTCAFCGEICGADWIRYMDGKPLCLDCFAEREDNN